MIKTCGRCKNAFECKFDDIQNCQCNTVKISGETHDFLQKTHFDCLCQQCLKDIENRLQILKDEILPPLNQLKEGFHFYKEGRYIVFTENFLILRGYCCKSGCRHCPYGFELERTDKK